MYFFRRLAAALLCALAVSGCGGPSGPTRLVLTGKVTLEGGKPVPYAEVSFDPDVEAGNTGVQGTGEIKDGILRTNPDFGPCPGFQVVRITAYDGKSPDARLPHGQYLGPTQTVKINLEPGATSVDFALKVDPKEAPVPSPPPPTETPGKKTPEPSVTPPLPPTTAPLPRATSPGPPLDVAEENSAVLLLVLLCRAAAALIFLGVAAGTVSLIMSYAKARHAAKRPQSTSSPDGQPAASPPGAPKDLWARVPVLVNGIVCVLALLATAEILLLVARVEQNTRHLGR